MWYSSSVMQHKIALWLFFGCTLCFLADIRSAVTCHKTLRHQFLPDELPSVVIAVLVNVNCRQTGCRLLMKRALLKGEPCWQLHTQHILLAVLTAASSKILSCPTSSGHPSSPPRASAFLRKNRRPAQRLHVKSQKKQPTSCPQNL